MNQQRLISILSGEDRSIGASMTRLGLCFAEPIYRTVVATHRAVFTTGLRAPATLPRRVISVGNITAGGTGKTPFVIEITRRLQALNTVPAILATGYKAGPHGSDEATEMRRELGSSVPVEAGRNRLQTGQKILAQHPGVNVFLLDDGFQHHRLKRDFDLVLIDATRPLGFGHVLPRGLLREPLQNLRRADALIVTRADQIEPAALHQLDSLLERLTGRPPLAHTAHTWTALRDARDQTLSLGTLYGQKIFAATALGNPAGFEKTLRTQPGVELLEHRLFPDHHPFANLAELNAAVFEPARQSGAEAIVTTEKDWVKWAPHLSGGHSGGPPLPVYRPVLQLLFLDGSDALDALLRKTLTHGAP